MFTLGKPVQLAYAVPDAKEAANIWSAQFGAGPFYLSEHIPVTDVLYRGKAATFDHTSAYGQWGDVMVELVQDHGTGPSVVREIFDPAESGLHHLAFFVDDLDEATDNLAILGFPLAMSATARGNTRFHFIDAVAATGHFIELYEPNTALLDFYRKVRESAQEWDGSDPLRTR
ncbi:MAG: VOC family protein [Actinomycetota bacterium]|nr:VOC family protein [Actinomycetota bacterium]